MAGWESGSVGEWVDMYISGKMDGWMGRCLDGWVDGWGHSGVGTVGCTVNSGLIPEQRFSSTLPTLTSMISTCIQLEFGFFLISSESLQPPIQNPMLPETRKDVFTCPNHCRSECNNTQI